MKQGQLLQRILSVIILVLVPLFVFKEYKHLTLSKHLLIHTDGELLKNEYASTENKSFVVLIFAHEQEQYCTQNLESVFAQSYPQFRVIYLHSGKGMENYRKAKTFISEHGYEDRVTFTQNTHEEELFNIFYQTVHDCRDNEVIVHLEGTDWLANADVLKTLNHAYKDPDVWLTYGDCMEYPSLRKQELAPTVNSILRDFRPDKTPWMLSHLKTYYAGLLKQMTPTSEGLSEQALSQEDKLLMLSLLKVGKWHVKFIPEVLTVYPEQDATNTGIQRFMDKFKGQKKYFSPRKSLSNAALGEEDR